MAVIKYNVEDVEAGGGGAQPEAGKMYAGKIVSITPRTQKAGGGPVSDLEVVVDIGPEFVRLWSYVKLPDDPNFGPSAWKFRELTDALGLPPKGSFDPKKNEGKPVNVKIVADVGQDGEYKGKIKNIFMPGNETAAEGSEPSAGGEGDEPFTEEELNEWSAEDLKAELEAQNLTVAGRFSNAKAIAALLEAQEAEPEDEPDAGGGGTDLSDIDQELLADLNSDADFYADWSDEDIKGYAEDLGITGNITGRKNRAKYVEAITSLAAGQGDTPAASEEVSDDYDTWPMNELEDEVNTRKEGGAEIKITGRKTQEKLIAALRADDSDAPF